MADSESPAARAEDLTSQIQDFLREMREDRKHWERIWGEDRKQAADDRKEAEEDRKRWGQKWEEDRRRWEQRWTEDREQLAEHRKELVKMWEEERHQAAEDRRRADVDRKFFAKLLVQIVQSNELVRKSLASLPRSMERYFAEHRRILDRQTRILELNTLLLRRLVSNGRMGGNGRPRRGHRS